MMMLFLTFTTLLLSLALASARDTGKFMKAVPTISNSLVNLGKMEISFYFNGKHADMPVTADRITHSDFIPLPPSLEQGCPCNDFKTSSSSFLSDPTDIINKILKSNDLFKDSTSSACCNSHEHMQESTLFFELHPNHPNFNSARNGNTEIQFPMHPSIQKSSLPVPTFLFNKPGPKPKAVEILLFPKRKDMANFEFTNFFAPKQMETVMKSDLQIVDDKPYSTKHPSASVKKDLTVMDKKNKLEDIEMPDDVLRTEAPPVTNVNNAL